MLPEPQAQQAAVPVIAEGALEAVADAHRTVFAARPAEQAGAGERTVPFGLYCYTITVAWYALHGHHPSDVAEHRERAPWYTTKTDPSLSDMVAKLRWVIIAARFMPTRPGQPTEQEIRTVQQA